VKLLLDQNLSPRLTRTLAAIHPGTTHVRDVGRATAEDQSVAVCGAAWARDRVQDADFHQRSFRLGPPPKVIWIRLGNCSTAEIETLLHARQAELSAFERDEHGAFLALG
jgi:predicted nuclease of predicted toxin-antitoxin system